MSTTLIIVILIVLALLLFAIEAFATPGLGVSGVCATLCVLAADVLTYYAHGSTAAIILFLVSTALVILFFWWFSKSKALDRMSLHSSIDSTAATAAQLSVKPGDEGHALTRLALIGNAEINGKTVEVKSDGGFIDEGSPIVVTQVNEALILVRRK